MKLVAKMTQAAVAATLAFAVPASAQTFTGYTNGCFYTTPGVACSPETTAGARTDVFGPLTYTNSTFNVTTAGGFAAIGNDVASPNINNLGSFSLPTGFTGTQDFGSQNFMLNVFFTAPAGVTPTNQNFMATLFGTVTGNAGGLQVNFDNTPKMFSFTGGSFMLSVADVNLTNTAAGTSIAVSGALTSQVVPEPSTYLLMASGLAGIMIMARRRRSA